MLVSQRLSPVFFHSTATSVAAAARAAAEQISQISEERPKEAGAVSAVSPVAEEETLQRWEKSGTETVMVATTGGV